MNRSKTVLFVLLGILLLGVVVCFVMDTSESDNGIDGVEHEMVRLHHPRPGQVIQSPLRVEGEARGMWYFEASFPVKLLTEDGRVIAEHYAMSDGEWMTEEFVPFTAQIPFSQPEGGSGWLVLERSNPSGLPEHADEVRIPVRYLAGESSEVSVYFNREEVAECETTVAVSRTDLERSPAGIPHLHSRGGGHPAACYSGRNGGGGVERAT